jgi:hypothetical protein
MLAQNYNINKKVYKALFNFFKVKESYLKDNLAKAIFKIKKQYNILYKIFTIIANNASNNNTLCYYL